MRKYYFIYFKEREQVAIFQKNMEKRDKIELPVMIFGTEHISSLNFSIPKKLYDLKIFFNKRIITFRFDIEEKKNKIGNDLKKKV
jgi:hypothetical protein